MCLHIDDFMNQDEHVSSDLTSNIIWLLALEQDLNFIFNVLPFQFVNIYHAISVYVVHSKGPSEGEMVKCGNFILVASRH